MKWVKTSVKNKTYYFDFSKTKTHTSHALDAAIKAVVYISENYPPPYTLLLSGGVDSQAMLWAWHKSKVPYKTLSAVYNHNLNDHDLETIRTFAANHDISINFTDFDLFNFLETEYESYSDKYFCGSPQICTFMKIADGVKEGTVIMSGNFIQRDQIVIPRNVAGLWHYKKLSNRNVIPYFFLETEDLAWAFNEYSWEVPVKFNYDVKVKTYQNFDFPIIPQEKKYNGFEKVKDWYDTNYKKPIPLENKVAKIMGQGSNRTFDLLYRNKFEVKFSQYKYVYKC